MSVQKQISKYIAAQPEPKYSEMQELDGTILTLMSACKLWFLREFPQPEKNCASTMPRPSSHITVWDGVNNYSQFQTDVVRQVYLYRFISDAGSVSKHRVVHAPPIPFLAVDPSGRLRAIG